MHYIVGLGNPGAEYADTRHNIGFTGIDALYLRLFESTDWRLDKTANALVATGYAGEEKVTLIKPQTFMNRSGGAVARFIKTIKAAEQLTVIYDDIDLPCGTVKIAFDRGSGGHKGIESIARSLKTKAFTRVRVGVAPTTPGGKIKKPRGEDSVRDFLLGGFSKKECERLEDIVARAANAAFLVATSGRAEAMQEINSSTNVA